MHDKETRVEVKALLKTGLSKTAVAKRLGVDRRTVDRWESGTAPPQGRKGRAHKLDPYKGIVRERLGSYPELSAQRLFEEVRAAGYAGGYGRVRDYVAELRAAAPKEPVVRFETPPGRQARWTSASSGCRGASGTRWWWCWGTRGCGGWSSFRRRRW